ncbi:MAG: PhnA protein, partial [Gammaproteobacteria bacterium]|nr:PhnA protein [Gammaproteobacteria bacterium]
MGVEQELHSRSGSKCELCNAVESLAVYEVPPESDGSTDQSVLICNTCHDQLEDQGLMDARHWHCLKDSMWAQVPAVQVISWRMLTRLNTEAWAQDLMDMFYLDEELLSWAQATGEGRN